MPVTVDHLDALVEMIISCLGRCRVGLIGEDSGLADRLAARGMACRDDGPRDAWVMITDIERLERGEGLPARGTAHPLFIVCHAAKGKADALLRVRVETAVIRHGYIKHPAMTELLGYAHLDDGQEECWSLFDYRPPVFVNDEIPDRLKRERDLHSDMLREPGVRSDAHIVRYQLAATLIRPGDSVLDAACGLGYGSHVLASLSPAARITGIDQSEWVVDFALRNYAGERVTFRSGSLPEALDDVADGSVDFIASLETLEHVPNPGALLAAFARALRPGGRIFVSVPNDWADESGRDPSPYHLQVYDWGRVKRELEACFIVESAWSLTASGCKTGPGRIWQPQPRNLDPVTLEAAPTTDAEWWLVCASKSPMDPARQAYEDQIHAGFLGQTHLVDFAKHYDRPWLVHSMVELPWRIRDRTALARLADQVIRDARPESADLGAALAVKGWRVFEDAGVDSPDAAEWLARVDNYLGMARISENPHVQRWCVSLEYLSGRFHEARDDVAAAVDAYLRVVQSDVLSITPTLGTKQADASLRAGLLAFRDGHTDQALAYWSQGLDAVFQCLHSQPIEFIGNRQKPFIFAMNDLVQIADGAALLANAMRTVASHDMSDRATVARKLASLEQQALRSALSALESRLGHLSSRQHQASTDLTSARREVKELDARLRLTTSALARAEQLAMERLDELQAQNQQRLDLELALQRAESLATARQQSLRELDSQLKLTTSALARAEQLAMDRLDELQTQNQKRLDLELALQHAESLAEARQKALSDMDCQLTLTTMALSRAEQLAMERLDELQAQNQQRLELELALQRAESLAKSRQEALSDMDCQLTLTTTALSRAEQLATDRLTELQAQNQHCLNLELALQRSDSLATARQAAMRELDSQLKLTTSALARAEQLAMERLTELQAQSQQSLDLELALQHAQSLAEARQEALLELDSQLKLTASALAHAEELALLRQSTIQGQDNELENLKRQLNRLHSRPLVRMARRMGLI